MKRWYIPLTSKDNKWMPLRKHYKKARFRKSLARWTAFDNRYFNGGLTN